MDENATQLVFETGNDEEYKVEGIRDSAVYISTFHKDNPDKPTTISPPVDIASPMAKPSIELNKCEITDQEHGRRATNGTSKKAKKN